MIIRQPVQKRIILCNPEITSAAPFLRKLVYIPQSGINFLQFCPRSGGYDPYRAHHSLFFMCAHHVIYPIGYLNDVSYYFNRARTHTPIFVIALFLYYLKGARKFQIWHSYQINEVLIWQY